jgi:ATP/maltotriose-dependent transcriptional regulator MalT
LTNEQNAAMAMHQESKAIATDLGIAHLVNQLDLAEAKVLFQDGKLVEASLMFETCESRAERALDIFNELECMRALAETWITKDIVEARSRADEALSRSSEIASPEQLGLSHQCLGVVLQAGGDLDGASETLKRSVDILSGIEHLRHWSTSLARLADVEASRGLISESEAHRKKSGELLKRAS